MKRYLVFAHECYCPLGGIADRQGEPLSSLEEAEKVNEGYKNRTSEDGEVMRYDTGYIYDIQENCILDEWDNS